MKKPTLEQLMDYADTAGLFVAATSIVLKIMSLFSEKQSNLPAFLVSGR